MENSNNTEVNTALKNSSDIFNAFKQKFSTSVHMVKINSLNKEVGFRDVTTKEQKTLSKISIENERRKDIIYDTQCELINTLCLDKEFNIYRLTEFDRIKILMEIYEKNYFKNEIKYKCKECGHENVYQLDFQTIIDRFDNFNLDDDIYTVDDEKYVFKFKCNYPNVRTVSNFYRDYMKKYKGLSNSQQEMMDNFGNIEYINLFIKEIEMIDKNNPNDKIVADMSLMTYDEIENLINEFPQNVVFAEHGGIINHITTNFIEKLNSLFQYEKCSNCGAESKEGIGSLTDFF